jgi:hypothetical protein
MIFSFWFSWKTGLDLTCLAHPKGKMRIMPVFTEFQTGSFANQRDGSRRIFEAGGGAGKKLTPDVFSQHRRIVYDQVSNDGMEIVARVGDCRAGGVQFIRT